MNFISIFTIVAGFILGLGAVTVIDLHGFLARKSSYWTEATIRTHKVTKPLIWIGISLVLLGNILMVQNNIIFSEFLVLKFILIILLILNGLFLSFVVSPRLLFQERKGREKELLPQNLQNRIAMSFVVSFVGWWSLVVIFVSDILNLV